MTEESEEQQVWKATGTAVRIVEVMASSEEEAIELAAAGEGELIEEKESVEVKPVNDPTFEEQIAAGLDLPGTVTKEATAKAIDD